MRRREFITLLSGAALLPRVARAQGISKIPRLGFLGVTFASSWASRSEALQLGLRNLGYEHGKNVVIEDLWAEESYDRLPALAGEFVRRKVDIILTYGTPGTLAAKRATTEIPIVFVYAGDAVGAGLVSNLARPEANVTGNTYFLSELMAKRLELLKDAFPHIARVFVDKILRGVKPANLPVDRATKFETVLNMRAAKTLGLSVPPLVLLRADRIIE